MTGFPDSCLPQGIYKRFKFCFQMGQIQFKGFFYHKVIQRTAEAVSRCSLVPLFYLSFF